MAETPMCALCKASVMYFDENDRKWKPAGVTQGLSAVCIYGNRAANQYRVVGRKETGGEVVINCAILANLKYNRATPTFHQWRDGNMKVYGINFSSSDEANKFASAMDDILATLKVGTTPQTNYQEQQRREREERERAEKERMERERKEKLEREQKQKLEKERQERERQEQDRLEKQRVAASTASIPAAPPAPPAPSGGCIPPPPPPVGIPAPPPPPPPVSVGSASSGGGGGLAAQLAAAKLKKTAPPADDGGGMGGLAAQIANARLKKSTPVEEAPKPIGGGGGMMAELQKRMARRKQQSQQNGSTTQNQPAVGAPKPTTSVPPTPKPAGSVSSDKKPWQKQNSTNSAQNTLNRRSSGTPSSSDLDQVKQEILSEMRLELQKFKDEILQAIRENK